MLWDAGCAGAVHEFRDSLDKLMDEKFSGISKGWRVSILCSLLPTQVPDNPEAVNPIKAQRFLEANTEVLTSDNAAEL